MLKGEYQGAFGYPHSSILSLFNNNSPKHLQKLNLNFKHTHSTLNTSKNLACFYCNYRTFTALLNICLLFYVKYVVHLKQSNMNPGRKIIIQKQFISPSSNKYLRYSPRTSLFRFMVLVEFSSSSKNTNFTKTFPKTLTSIYMAKTISTYAYATNLTSILCQNLYRTKDMK